MWVQKLDAQTDAAVPGAVFNISRNESMTPVIRQVTTGSDGKALVGTYDEGTYYVQEIAVPHPYVLNNTVQSITLVAGQTATFTQRNHKNPGTFKLKKVDERTGDVLTGAQYLVARNDDMTDPFGTFTTGTDGTFTVPDLPAGTYYYQETAAPSEDYILDDTIYSFTINWAAQTDVTVMNARKPGAIKITKLDADTDQPVAGAVFELAKTADMLNATRHTTGADGTVTIENLEDGTYYVREAELPDPYQIISDVQEILVEPGKTATFTARNVQQMASFEIRKVDVVTGIAQGSGTLAGATFDVIAVSFAYDDPARTQQPGDIMEQLTTDETGTIRTSLLPLGTYEIRETQSSQGYVLNGTSITVTSEMDDKTQAVSGKITQVTFNDQALIDQYNEAIDQLNAILAANNPELDQVLDYVESYQDGTSILFMQLPVLGRISVTKFMGETEMNPGVITPEKTTFTVTSQTTGAIVDTIITGESGRGSSKWLPGDTYTVSQTSGPDESHFVDDFEVTISIEHGLFHEYHYILENAPVQVPLQIVKVDAETGNEVPLAGFTFELYDQDMNIITMYLTYPNPTSITQFTTDASGCVTLPQKIVPGSYYIKEVQTQAGYMLAEEAQPFTFNDKTLSVLRFEFENVPQKGQLELDKRGDQLVSFAPDADGVYRRSLKTACWPVARLNSARRKRSSDSTAPFITRWATWWIPSSPHRTAPSSLRKYRSAAIP